MSCIFTSQGFFAGVKGADLHSGLWSIHMEKNKMREIILFILLVNKSRTVIHEK